MISRSKAWWTKRITAEPDVPGYAVYRPTLAKRLWGALGFREPHGAVLTAQQVKEGWDEQVFVHTILAVSFADRLRLIVSGRAKLFTIVSAKVVVPEALTSVGFGVLPPGGSA